MIYWRLDLDVVEKAYGGGVVAIDMHMCERFDGLSASEIQKGDLPLLAHIVGILGNKIQELRDKGVP